MKFPQLPLGARFRYRGQIFCKSSPLAAVDADGGSRMIPRSANVEPLDEQDTATQSRASPLHRRLAAHHASSLALIREAAQAGPDGLAELEQRLADTYSALLADLD